MNNGIRKILVTISLVFCLFGAVFTGQVKAEDANTGSEAITYERKVLPYTEKKVSEYLADKNSYPTVEGYLFAGWYTDEKCDETCYLGVNEPSGTTYALFIPRQVLGVEAQISYALTDNSVTDEDKETSIRFVTSVDSLNYREVGFYVTYTVGGVEYNEKSSSKKVYKELYYVGNNESVYEKKPHELFCNLSTYFKAGTVLDVPENFYGTEFKVQPFWVTMEGTTVKGDEVVKSIDMGCTRDEVYVSSVTGAEGNVPQDTSYYGMEDYPYASLDYAIAHVNDNGTVHVKDSLTVASGATWTAHGKTITITGDGDATSAETLDLSNLTQPDGTGKHLYVNDNVTFSDIKVQFPTYVFANGYHLIVASNVDFVNHSKTLYIYGGGYGSISSDTNLELYAGSYTAIFGGCHQGNVNGNTNVIVGANVNPNATATDHTARDYMLYGGCRRGNVNKNTNVIVQEGAKFDAVYGGGGSLSENSTVPQVKGTTNVEFAGKAYSVFGGSRYGTNANTQVQIIGGEVYQVFGGCEHNSMEGNTDVQILGGKVYRRIYGGCYNDYSETEFKWATSYQVTGTTSVTIGTAVDLNKETDNALCAISRIGKAENETGILIFQNGLYSELSNKVHNLALVGAHAYNYLVDASAGGEVFLTKDGLSLTPDSGKKVLVRLDNSATGEVAYYNDAKGTYSLPELKDSTREIYVEFSEDIESADIKIVESENGAVTSSKSSYYPGNNTATLTVSPEDGYYCKSLTVTKDGVEVALTPEFALNQKTYTFDTEAGEYTVEASFVERVFTPPSNVTNTSWNAIRQNENREELSNGGIKISGTVAATDKLDGDSNLQTINSYKKYTDVDFTLTVKEGGEEIPSGTTAVFNFGSYVLQVRAVNYQGKGVVLRVVGGMSKNDNVYSFNEAQSANYNSEAGAKVRFVRCGTELYAYVDKTLAYTFDLAQLSVDTGKTEVTASTTVNVGIKWFADTNASDEIPFVLVDTILPSVNITKMSNGTVISDKAVYSVGDTATLTIKEDTGYYCNKLIVKKDGEVVSFAPELTFHGKTYTFEVEEGIYTVEASFVERVFTPPSNVTNTSWNAIRQNENREELSNGGIKISGTVAATDKLDGDSGLQTLDSYKKYTDVDFTLTVKEGGEEIPSGTTAVFNFGSYVLQVRAVNYQGKGVVLRVVGGMSKNDNVYSFNEAQSANYNSEAGAKVRFVRCGTELYTYVDGTLAYTFDLAQLSVDTEKTEVTASTTVNVGIKWFADTNASDEIPFVLVDTILPSVNMTEMSNGTVTADKKVYSVGDTATLTVKADTGYYCNDLVVKKNGEKVSFTPELAFEGKTYTFEVEEGIYTVEASFVERVFTPPSNVTNTSWDVIKQNESTETLENGGTKITGKVYATDILDGDSSDTLRTAETYTDVDLTFIAKGDSTKEGTTAVFDFNGYTFSLRAIKRTNDGVVLRVVGGSKDSAGKNYFYNPYTFDADQTAKYESAEGVEVRLVRCGTELYMYVDGKAGEEPIDLKALSEGYRGKTIVAEDTTVTLGFQWFGVTDTEVEIPFSITDKVSPVAVEVYNGTTLAASDIEAADVQNIHLTSNETYSVKLTPQEFDTTAHFKITYVDHVTKETKIVYTPVVATGESFEFTYKNGVFNAETEADIATILWENRIKATKDVLTVEVVAGEPEGEVLEANAVIGREPMEKPGAVSIATNWTMGSAISSNGEVTENAAYAYTDVITVAKKGTKLYFTYTTKTNSWADGEVFVVSSWEQDENSEWIFDAEGTNIAGQYTTGEITCTAGYETFIERYNGEKITYTYITSEDNENIRFCYYAGEGTTTFPKVYSIYSGETGTAVEIALAEATDTWLEKDKTRAYYDIFEGKTISVIGDSYMAGSSIKNTSNVWVNMFAKKYGMTINNHGVNGSTISNYAGSTHNPMVDRWETDFAKDNPNIIIVEGGRNDYNYNTPIGEIGTTDKGTFKGATTYLISSLKEKYPNAIIIGITCWEVGGNRNAAGYYCSDYGRAFIDVCEKLKIPYVNAMDSEDIDVYMTVSNFRGRFCIKAGDISHLNEKGMKLVLPIFEEKIYGFCSNFEWKDEPQEETHSVRIMSNNLWNCDNNTAAWSAMGYDCSAPARAKGFLNVYSETMPDVIGTQECSELMQAEIWNNLIKEGLAYDVVDGGYTPIFYNTSTLELVESEHEIYPAEYSGLTGSFNNSNTKSWTIAVFNVKATGDKFILLNTHLWYMNESAQAGSDAARKVQMEIAIAKLKEYHEEYQCESYLVGDLNATYASEVLQYAFNEEFKHAHDIAVDFVDETKGMHKCDALGFEPITDGEFKDSIDHILVYGESEGSVRTFKRFSEDYYASLSDHLPVYIDVEF